MKQIPLTKGLVAIVDDCDYARLLELKWRAFFNGNSFYAVHGSGRKPNMTIYMHRLILYAPRGVEIDHISGNSLDNRRSNLRLATRAQNARNCKVPRTNKSGFKGVYLHNQCQRWVAQIRFGGKNHCLGLFDTPEEAALEYDKGARMVFGKFARLNFPPTGHSAGAG